MLSEATCCRSHQDEIVHMMLPYARPENLKIHRHVGVDFVVFSVVASTKQSSRTGRACAWCGRGRLLLQ